MDENDYHVWLAKFIEGHKKQYPIREGRVTAGEFFGFRTAYTAITGKPCPAYKAIGRLEHGATSDDTSET